MRYKFIVYFSIQAFAAVASAKHFGILLFNLQKTSSIDGNTPLVTQQNLMLIIYLNIK